MKKAQVIVLTGAVLSAGAAGLLALTMLGQEPQQKPEAKIDVERILVAASDIQMGSTIKSEMLQWQEWPKKNVAPGFVTKQKQPDAISTINGSIARTSIYQGEPLRENRLVKSNQGFMSAILPKGQRAVATRISTATSAGGFILPNDRVDVLMTRRRSGQGQDGFQTEVILENVRVLAIDQTIQEKDGEPVVIGETATLQLSPQQVEILSVAQSTAERLSLALRSIEDASEEPGKIAEHLLVGGRGTVRVIRYGNVKETSAPSRETEEEK